MRMLHGTWQLPNETGKLAENITRRWLIGLRETNPAILDMFHERDKRPYRDLLPWSGEFAGKHLTGAYMLYQLTRDEALKRDCLRFLSELQSCIDEGYIGCFQRECRLTGAYSQTPDTSGHTWDAWSHYHCMLGLYLWYKETGDASLFASVQAIAERFLRTFYATGKRLLEIGSTEMNLAPLHIFALLYLETKEQKYLDFALEIVRDLEDPSAGDYIRCALSGQEFYQCPKPRWESLHVLLGVATLYRATGEAQYLDAARHMLYSILKTDIHNTGAFSTEEQAIGNPFVNGNIELCCVVAFNAFASELYQLLGDPAIVDHLELSLYNAVMGSFSPSGRWSTYNTPMEGSKCANYQSIVFQSRPGSPDLNCCSVNAPRGVGTLSEWAFLEADDTLYINYFEACRFESDDGARIEITGAYPLDGEITLRVQSPYKRVALRIPAWSKDTAIQLQDAHGAEKRVQPQPGAYCLLETDGGALEARIRFDFSTRLLAGGGDYAGKWSIYRGPILFGCDLALNDAFPESLRESELQSAQATRGADGRIRLELSDRCTLSDFYRLGSSGSAYMTWFALQ